MRLIVIVRRTAIALSLIFLASPSYGMMYRWIDAEDVRHYTNKIYEIPPRYRAKAKALYPESGDNSESLLKTEVLPKAAPDSKVSEKSRKAELQSPAKKKVPINTMTKQPITRARHGKDWKPEPNE